MAVKPIPEGFHTVTPSLVVKGAATLIEFLKQAFEAREIRRIQNPEGCIIYAEVKIGDSLIMLSEATGEFQPMPSSIYLYVENTDATYESAIEAGGTSLMEPKDEFWGDRQAGLKDLSGNHWWIATHQEDVSPEDLSEQLKILFGDQAKV
ncbi:MULTISPECIES: VOC family protein [Nostocales]|uniref:Glyoxalase n=3 Tax=Nostocales TaxID=1161 RepID=A0A0C1RNG4_9CYAN|nr:VOC family protein [Tolypothrix bouteillei]KAF3884194.1 VOC family protein [Tolypothrix bouteillei VB521301]